MAKLSILSAAAVFLVQGVLSSPTALRPASAADPQPASQPDSNPSVETLAKLSRANPGDYFVEGNTAYIFLNRTGNANEKRQSPCTQYQYQAVQVPQGQTGTWWGSWEPATACRYAGDSSGDPANCQQQGYSVTTSWSYSAGFSTGLAGSLLDILNGNAAFNFGYTWGQSATNSSTWTCCPGSDPVAQIWTQSKYGWSNSQVQTCQSETCYPYPVNCGAWSAYQHANWALTQGDLTTALGCSTGWNNVNCNA